MNTNDKKSYLLQLGSRIRALRLDRGMSQDELAQKSGYTSRSSINKIELGINDVPQSKIKAIADALHVPVNAILDKNAQGEALAEPFRRITTQRVPLLGDIACGEPIMAAEDLECYVEAGAEIQCDFCLRAKGESMINARIHDGDIVFIRKQDIVENGEIAAVIIDDDVTLKRVYYNQNENNIILQAENPAFRPLMFVGEQLDHVHILGKAVAFQSDVK